MVEFIPNQEGQKVEENKEEEIIKNGGEITTDDLSNIKLIDVQEYNKLNDDSKKLYVKYSPSLTSQAYAMYINSSNALIEQYNKLGPIIQKMPDFNTIANVEEAIKPIENVSNKVEPLVDTINSIADMPIVGVVAQPLLDLLTIIGGVAAMFYTMIRNPFMMVKAYKEAFDSIDLESLKNIVDSETTPNLDNAISEMDSLVIPDKEIKEKVTENVEQIKTAKNTIQKAIETSETINKLLEQTTQVQQAMDTTISVLGILAGNAPTIGKQMIVTEYEKAVEENSKDYTKDSQQVANNINSFIHNIPQKYIKIEDLEKLKKATNDLKNT